MITAKIKLPDGTLQKVSVPDDWSPERIAAEAEAQFGHLRPATTGLKGIGNDIKASLSNMPETLASILQNLPGQVYESGKQALTNPARAVANVGAGTLEGLTGIANIPSNVAAYLGSKDIGRGSLEDAISKAHLSDAWIRSAMGAPQPGDELLQGLGNFAPFGGLGGEAEGLSGLASRAAANTAYATSQNQNPLTAALMGMAAEGVTHALQKGLAPGRFLPSSPLSNEELKQAANSAQGTETDLGNIIQNPSLKRKFENRLPDIAYSGAYDTMQRTGKILKNRGQQIVEDFKGNNNTSNIGASLQTALKAAEKETRAQKNAHFDELNNAADAMGISTNRANIREAAKDALDKINRDKDLAAANGPEANKLLEEFATPSENENFSLKDTDILRGVLRKKADEAYKTGNENLSTIYGNLKKASLKDLNDAIDKAGDENLNALRNKAMTFYANEYAPFKEKEIMKYTREGADADTLINAFLKTSPSTDRSNLLSKLTTKLSPEDRNLLSYSYLSRAFNKKNQVRPGKLETLYSNLGENQKAALFTPEQNQRLSEYGDLVNINKDVLHPMFNPMTGQKGNPISLLNTLLATLGTAATGHIPLGLAIGLAPNMIARPAVKALTNETLRNKIIDAMINARAKNAIGPRNLAPAANALTQASQNPMEININKYAGQG